MKRNTTHRNANHWFMGMLLGLLASALPAGAFYNPHTGRWLTRDPIGEHGGVALFALAHNDPVSFIDALGRRKFTWKAGGVEQDFHVTADSLVVNPCWGGPLYFSVSFYVNTADDGNNWFTQAGADFFYRDDAILPPANTTPSPPVNLQRTPHMEWDNVLSRSLPVCPLGRQTGSVTFVASTSEFGEALTAQFSWEYACDCACREIRLFTSVSTFAWASPPVYEP